MKKLPLLIFLLCINYVGVLGQINTTGGLTATDIVNILQGSDIIITNETISCPDVAYGSYDNGAPIGMTAGALLTSGSITNAEGPNNAGGTSTNNGAAGNPLITNITGVNTFDACVLEFDFIPIGNTFVFNYVFGSEEYFEYVCSGFNDGFGFFLTGPNPAGGNYTDQNIATLPNGTPVSINSINDGNPIGNNCVNNQGDTCPCNPEFYVDNTGGTTTEYDGYTVPLNVNQTVVPCESYHIIIAIADGGDGVFDSGVFIENFSINSENDFETVVTPAFENCNDGMVTFEINNALAYDLNIDLNILNTSSANNTDYSGIPASTSIVSGNTTTSFNYNAISDNLDECTEDIVVEYTYNLDCGLLTDTMYLEVKDGIVLECPATLNLACNAAVPPPNPATVTVVDECSDNDNITVVHLSDVNNNANGCGSNTETITRTYRATDICGNSQDCQQIITIAADAVAPSITHLSDQNGITCGAAIPAAFTTVAAFIAGGGNVTDECGSISIASVDNDNGQNGCAGNTRIITRTYTFTDDCNNSRSFNQTFTYATDSQGPTIGCPSNVNGLACDAAIPTAFTSITAFINGGGTVSDNCSPNSSLSISHNNVFTSNNVCNNRNLQRTYTIEDACGNASSCTQTFTFLGDSQAPIITATPNNQTGLLCGASIPTAFTTVAAFKAAGGSVTDDCSTLSISHSDATNGGTGCSGSPTIVSRTYTFTDACNNSNNTMQTFTYDTDSQGPTIGCPSTINGLACNAAVPNAHTSIGAFLAAGGTVSDNCSANNQLSISHNDVDSGLNSCNNPSRTIQRTYTITDVCNNSSSCVQSINFLPDTQNPVISATVPNQTSIACGAPLPSPYTTIVAFENAGGSVTDNCSVISIGSVDSDNGNNGCAGNAKVITRTYTFTDACNNSSSFDQLFTYDADNQVPTIGCPTDLLNLTCGDAVPNPHTSITDFINAGGSVSDNCSPLNEMTIGSSDIDSGINTCSNPSRTITRTYTITDACGFSSNCTQTITFQEDTQGPTIVVPLPDEDGFTCNSDIPLPYTTIVSFTTAGGMLEDNCSEITAISSQDSDNLGDHCEDDPRIITRVYTFEDECGNESSFSQIFTYANDNTAPIVYCAPNIGDISCETDIPVPYDSVGDFIVFGGTVTDNCSSINEMTINHSDVDSGCNVEQRYIERTYTITDVCGNSTQCVQLITFARLKPGINPTIFKCD